MSGLAMESESTHDDPPGAHAAHDTAYEPVPRAGFEVGSQAGNDAAAPRPPLGWVRRAARESPADDF